jgi:hypothetical protein
MLSEKSRRGKARGMAIETSISCTVLTELTNTSLPVIVPDSRSDSIFSSDNAALPLNSRK